MVVLVDSDILIELSRGKNKEAATNLRTLLASGQSVLYSPVSAAEIWRGARPREFDATTRLFRTFKCAPTDYPVGKLAGKLLQRFSKSHALEVPDALLAATAVARSALLWTRNRQHDPMPELTFY